MSDETVYDRIKARVKPETREKVKRQMASETANKITANIIRVVNLTPQAVAYRINNVGVWDAAKGIHRAGNTEKGLPDVWACYKGRFVVIEVKAGKDKLSIDQEKRKFEILKAGGVWFTAHSTDGFLAFWSNLKNELDL